MVHVWYYSQATKACITSQNRRDGVYLGINSRRIVRQYDAG